MIGFPRNVANQQTAWARRRPYPTFAARGMVAAAHPLTVETGVHVLRQGGNAIDAAVAAGLTAAVVMPEMCGLGGDLFALIHDPRRGGVDSIHGSGIAPRNSSVEQMRRHGGGDGRKMPYQGPLSISVPGMVDAYFTLLDRYGSLPFASVAEPAIAHAADGFPLQTLGAGAIAGSAEVLARDAAAAAVFLPAGQAPTPGTIFKQTDLGRTLHQIATDGRETFYRGDVADRILAYLGEVGGALTHDDFADHTTEVTTPLSIDYRGHTVYQTGLPTQGLIMLGALNIIEHAPAPLDPLSAGDVHLMVEAKKLAYADRLRHAGDPTFVSTPLDDMLSKPWAKDRHASIDPTRAGASMLAGQHQSGDTTYICVVDGDGMMVSLIQSVSSAFGSGVVGGDTGVVLNNRAGRGFTLEEGHPNTYAPGKKTMHTLNCFLIADEQGRPVLVGGTPGGDGQPQWNMQTIVGMVDAGLDVQAAIELPRWTSWPGTDPLSIDNPFELRIEDRMGADTIASLAALGHDVRTVGAWSAGGASQVIVRDPTTGVMAGGSDPRVEGSALGF
ncbi:MAG: gamma-glutamyltransferase [Chloroflexia bacterium]|nr:gamma-glutamyltransferase [Chloroflexia bacterium]